MQDTCPITAASLDCKLLALTQQGSQVSNHDWVSKVTELSLDAREANACVCSHGNPNLHWMACKSGDTILAGLSPVLFLCYAFVYTTIEASKLPCCP